MNIHNIKINNVLGIEGMEIKPDGNVIQVHGKNGQGKTSVMEAVKDALGVSEYSSLLRNGAEKGEVVLDLGDMLIRKAHTEKGSKLSLKGLVAGTDKMSALSGPAGILKSLVAPNSVDPVRLLTASNKDLVNAVLEAMPMSVDEQIINDLVKQGALSVTVDPSDHALVTISKVRKEAFNERTGINRELKTVTTTHDQLKDTLPEVIPSMESLAEEIQANEQIIEGARSAARKAKREMLADYSDNIRDAEQYVESLTNELAKAKADLASIREDAESEAERVYDEELKKATEAEEMLKNSSDEKGRIMMVQNTAKQVDGYSSHMKSLKADAEKLTGILDRLESYKEELCNNLPIKGMELRDGKMFMNDVPFETLNTAARVDLVLELARLSAGKLGLVVLDNSELMDTETYEAFIAKAKETDLQFLVARVTDDELKVQ